MHLLAAEKEIGNGPKFKYELLGFVKQILEHLICPIFALIRKIHLFIEFFCHCFRIIIKITLKTCPQNLSLRDRGLLKGKGISSWSESIWSIKSACKLSGTICAMEGFSCMSAF